MAYSEPDLPVTGTSISSANFGIPVRNNQVDHQARLLVLEANAMQLIAEHAVASDAEYLVEFDSIPATYRHLKIVGQARAVNGSSSSGNAIIYLRLNDDTGNNYTRLVMSSNATSGTPTINLHSLSATSAYSWIGSIPTDDSAAPENADFAANIEATIANYRGTAFYKSIHAMFHSLFDGGGHFQSVSTVWKSASAITKISLCPATTFGAGVATFKTGSYFSLYGMK